jgi:hypothetical protein
MPPNYKTCSKVSLVLKLMLSLLFAKRVTVSELVFYHYQHQPINVAQAFLMDYLWP